MNISVATNNQLVIIKELAYQIWPKAYHKILSKQQLDYMLDLMYSIESLTKQMDYNHIFLLVEDSNSYIGFASFELNYDFSNKTKIQKLYVLPQIQGKGIGKMLIDFIEKKAIENNQSGLLLNVNKYNTAKDFYLKQGYKISYSEVIDIGKGYVMDDYILEKEF
jgi:GNAT superfamily N-acetyltransferase